MDVRRTTASRQQCKPTIRHGRSGRGPTIFVVAAALAVGAYAAPASHTARPQPRAKTESHAESASTHSGARPKFTENSTLRDYLKVAALNNPGLRAAHDRWRAAMQVIPQATSLPDPQFSYTYFIQPVETRVGPQRQKLGLMQMFPWFGKLRLRGDKAAKAAEAAWLDFQDQRLKLFYRVSVAYCDYYYLKQATDVTQQNFDLLKRVETVARERFQTGNGLTAVNQAQVELGKLEDRLESLRELRPALAAQLNAALNRDRNAFIPWPAKLPDKYPKVDDKTVLDEVRRLNPELTRFTVMAQKERIAAELARKDGYPNFTLGLSVIDTGPARMTGTPGSGKDPVMATIALNLPIWRGKYRAERYEAQLRRDAALEQRTEKGNDLEAEAKMALFSYRDAGRKVGLYRDTLLPKARESFAVALQAFQAGKADFTTLIDAERLLLDFQLAAAKARTDRRKCYAELQMLTGSGMLQQQADSTIAPQ